MCLWHHRHRHASICSIAVVDHASSPARQNLRDDVNRISCTILPLLQRQFYLEDRTVTKILDVLRSSVKVPPPQGDVNKYIQSDFSGADLRLDQQCVSSLWAQNYNWSPYVKFPRVDFQKMSIIERIQKILHTVHHPHSLYLCNFSTKNINRSNESDQSSHVFFFIWHTSLGLFGVGELCRLCCLEGNFLLKLSYSIKWHIRDSYN